MTRFVKSILVFLLFFVAAFWYMNAIFRSEHYYVNTIEDYKELASETNIDVLIYGSSHAYTAFNPLLIDSVANTVSYNLGSDGLRLSFTDLMLAETIDHTQPKLVVLELYRGSFVPIKTAEAKGYQLRALDAVPNFSVLKFNKIKQYYKMSELLSAYVPLFRNHHTWNKVQYFKPSNRKEFDGVFNTNGFIGATLSLSKKDSLRYSEFKVQPTRRSGDSHIIDSLAKRNFKQFVTVARNKNAEVLVVTAPDLRIPFTDYGLIDEIAALCDAMDVPYLNMNAHFDTLDLEVSDFKDPAHMNLYGANKASRLLGQYIAENYSIPDRAQFNKNRQLNDTLKAMRVNYYNQKSIVLEKELANELLPGIAITHLKVEQNLNEYFIDVKLNAEDNLDLGQYRLGIHLVSTSKNQDNLTGNILLKNTGKKIQFETTIKKQIDAIGQIKLFLYHSSGYIKTLGSPIWIDYKN